MTEGSPLFCVLSQESLVDLCNVIVFLVDIFCHMVLPLVTYWTSSFCYVFAMESYKNYVCVALHCQSVCSHGTTQLPNGSSLNLILYLCYKIMTLQFFKLDSNMYLCTYLKSNSVNIYWSIFLGQWGGGSYREKWNTHVMPSTLFLYVLWFSR